MHENPVIMNRCTRCLILSAVVLAGATICGLGLYTWGHWSPSALVYERNAALSSIRLPHPLRNGAEHDAAKSRNRGEPYILETDAEGSGALLYYGAAHTQEANHPQIADIESRWEAFQPTVALCEGRSRGYFYGALIEPFAGLPEPAAVHKLARLKGVKLYSLEPAYEREVAMLLRKFKPEQVALYFFLRVYVAEAAGLENRALAEDLLSKRTEVEGLRGVLPSVGDLDSLWERDFRSSGHWSTLTQEPPSGYLADISHESRRLRGEHMIRVLVDLVRSGERVFAVVGSGHVIRQEWNLRALLGMPPAWDQPR